MTLVGGHVWVCLLTLACNAGVLLDISSSRSFIRPAMFDVELVPSLHRNKLGGGLFWRRFSFFIECGSAKFLNVFQKKEPLTSAVSKSHICEFRSATAGAINGPWSLCDTEQKLDLLI